MPVRAVPVLVAAADADYRVVVARIMQNHEDNFRRRNLLYTSPQSFLEFSVNPSREALPFL